MKRVVFILLLLAAQAKADVIVSGLFKRSEGPKTTENNASSVVTKSTTGAITSTTTAYGSSSVSSTVDSVGVLVQGIVENVALGAGIFQDQTVILSLGYRFK